MKIFLGKIKIDQLRGNVGVFWGENTMWDWHTHSKANSGLGRISGDGNYIGSKLNYVDDQDIIDLFLRKPGRKKAGDII